jgi:3-oxoacyl-[acyl-carrier-protein] synthase II
MKKKVYILDYESITPLGLGDDEIFQSLKSNKLPGKNLEHFSTAGLKTHGAACVESDLEPLIKQCSEQVKELAHFDRKFELLVATFKKCEKRLRSVIEKCDSKRAGVVLGVGLDVSPLEKIDKYMQEYKKDSLNAFSNVLMDFNEKNENRVAVFQNPLDLSSMYLAEELGLGAFQKTVISACTSSTQAIALAYRSLHRGDTDIVLTGGTDSILNLMAYTAFGKLGVIAKSDKPIHEYCMPFDKNRTGALVGEAAGLCLMVGEDFVK